MLLTCIYRMGRMGESSHDWMDMSDLQMAKAVWTEFSRYPMGTSNQLIGRDGIIARTDDRHSTWATKTRYRGHVVLQIHNGDYNQPVRSTYFPEFGYVV